MRDAVAHTSRAGSFQNSATKTASVMQARSKKGFHGRGFSRAMSNGADTLVFDDVSFEDATEAAPPGFVEPPVVAQTPHGR